MKDDTGEKRRRVPAPRFRPRIALLACIALVVLSLGVALTPRGPQQPVDPPFSERARASALSDTLRLRAAAERLGSSAPGAGQASLARTVTLLTTQGRALLSPADKPASPPPEGPPAPSATAPPSAAPPASAAGLAGELAASGSRRLADAATADGGPARLLAAVGTAQLLEASALAAATATPLPAQPDPAAPPVSGTCPSAPAGPGSGATAGRALEAAVRNERESVYAYQLAITRLGGDPARAAAGQLARHEALLAAAEALGLRQCIILPPSEAGYAVAPSFPASPAAGLAGLEAGALPVYGDLVGLGDAETRRWAVSALVGTARAAVLWGADPGPLPGLAADPESFPPLPAPTPP